MRVVNALLTQLDQLRRYKNALVLTTSNITGAIDAAFVDRADIKMYIGPPGVEARYTVLAGCVAELARVGVIAPFPPLLDVPSLSAILPSPPPTFEKLASLPSDDSSITSSGYSMMLHAVACACEGLSGRALRKLPFLAHALHAHAAPGVAMDARAYLAALYEAARSEHAARSDLSAPSLPQG